MAKQINNVSDLGTIIRQQRKKRGYTIDEVSAHANCGVRYLGELERGKNTAEIGKALAVCRVLGIHLAADNA